MTPSLQMPVRHEPATQVGPRVFRKQILRKGEIEHKGQTLRFDDAYLKTLVDSFNAGAFDQVPLVLADAANKHNESPENFRGEVKALAMTDDGLDAVVEMTAKGAELVRDNPRLGVSPRLVEDLVQTHGRFPHALRHVCATLDPVGTQMRGWETVSTDSVLSATHSSSQVIDLTAATFMSDSATLTDDHLEALKGLEGDERSAKARELLGVKEEPEATKEDPKPDDKPNGWDKLKKALGIKDEGVSAEEFSAAVEELNKEADEAKEPVGATLSAEDRKEIDLAREEARSARRETAEANWKLERKEYADAGVPPAMLDLCEPIFKDGAQTVIDLSNGDKFDSASVIRKLLDEAKGYVDLSSETGSSAGKDDDEREAARKAADNWPTDEEKK